jgi:hypothetical protein
MIRSRNTIDERAQDFVMNYKLLLPMLKHTRSEPAHYTLLEIPEIFSTCLVLEQSVAPTNSSVHQSRLQSAVSRTAPHHPHPPPLEAISWSVACKRSEKNFLSQLAPPPRMLVNIPSCTDQRQCSSRSSSNNATDTKFYELTSYEVYEFIARYHTHPSEYFPRFTKLKYT